MKIYPAYYTHKPGGFCKRLYRLLLGLARSGHEVHYFTLDTPPISAPNFNVRLIPFPTRARSGVLFFASFLLWLPFYITYKAFRDKPDRLVMFGAFYGAVAAPARVFLRIPVILFIRSLVFKIDAINQKPGWVRAISNTADRIGCKCATRIVCMTRAMAHELSQFAGIKESKIAILANDLPPKIEQNSIFSVLPHDTPKKPILLTSGVLDARKNIGILLQALALAQLDCVVVVAGEGPLRKKLEQEAARLSLSHVHFVGWISKLSSWLGGVTLTVHPALHEGMSNSILESLSADVPVLAADIPEFREILPDERLLFAPQSAADLAQKLTWALSNIDTARQISSAQALTYRFDWDAKAISLATEIS